MDIYYIGPQDGQFTDPNNWSSGTVPGFGDVAHVPKDASLWITGSVTLNALVLGSAVEWPKTWRLPPDRLPNRTGGPTIRLK